MIRNKEQTLVFPYDVHKFYPPAPTLEISLSSPIPESSESVRSLALLDSGADMTVIPQKIVHQLRLKRVGDIIAGGFDGSRKYYSVYSVKITIDNFGDFIIRTLSESEDYVTIGRDILNKWLLFLKGPNNIFEIS